MAQATTHTHPSPPREEQSPGTTKALWASSHVGAASSYTTNEADFHKASSKVNHYRKATFTSYTAPPKRENPSGTFQPHRIHF